MSNPAQRLGLVLAALVLALGACTSDGGPDVDLSGDPELEKGQAVYNTNCARCHGPGGGGGVGPALDDGQMTEKFPDIEDQIEIITSGVGSMPAWEGTLSPDEIRAVARYEREIL